MADRPERFGVQYITTAQQQKWEAKYGENWADEIEPETRTTIADFRTLATARAFVASEGPDRPSGYFDRIFERVNVRPHEEGPEWGFEWDEREISE